MDRNLNNAYFEKKSPIPGIVLIVIGIVLIFMGTRGSDGGPLIFIGIVMIAIGAFLVYKCNNSVSDQQYDQSVAQNLVNIKQRALNKLGVDEEEVKEIEPLVVSGYKFMGASKFKKGKDYLWRTNRFEVTMLFFSANEVHCYNYAYNTTDSQQSEKTDVYFYQDVVSVSTESKSANVVDSQTGKPDVANYETFKLQTAGGNALDVSIRDLDDAQRSINAMRQLLRAKKAEV